MQSLKTLWHGMYYNTSFFKFSKTHRQLMNKEVNMSHSEKYGIAILKYMLVLPTFAEHVNYVYGLIIIRSIA